MPLPNVASLYEKIQKGHEGGGEFARIITQLLKADSLALGYDVIYCSDRAGDYNGVDAIVENGFNKQGFQYKFIPGNFSSAHKTEIKSSLLAAKAKLAEMTEWVLVTPEDISKSGRIWLDELSVEFEIKIVNWGHSDIIGLMLKYPHVAKFYYPDLVGSTQPSFINREPTFEDEEKYFGRFLDPDVDNSLLLLKAQPSLADCRAVFIPKYFKEVSDIYYFQYRQLLIIEENWQNVKSKEEYKLVSNTLQEIKTQNHHFPGGMHLMLEKEDVFNAGIKFYRVVFKLKANSSGTSFNVWCFINGRWVFFPRPWAVIRSINAMENDKELKRMVKWFKILGLGKENTRKNKMKALMAVNHITNKLFEEK